MNDPKNSDEVLLAAALEQPAAERAIFLNGACVGDPARRARLDSLLQAQVAAQAAPATADARASAQQGLIASHLEEEIGAVIGRYKLLEKVGEGGFGVVYVAEQKEPVKRRVALKIIKLGMDTRQVVARFEAERQALALMDHPNIAKVLDAGATETGRPYFVMELVRGIKITEYCDLNNLSTGDRLDLFIAICHAIQHAHQKGIIHRDIKPSNILVTLHDGVPVPKVIDFGIAKATQGELTEKTVYTQLQQCIGTPAYMSPEQAEMSGLDVDTRSDIYSLGVLLYELLTGGTPFDREELAKAGWDEMRRTIRETEPLRPSTRLSKMQPANATELAKRRGVDVSRLVALLRGDLDWIVMKCLEKDRTRRYETANGLARDIVRHLHHEPVTACPPSAAYRFRKLVRRNQLAFAAAGAVVFTLVFGIIGSTWQMVRAKRAEQEQHAQRVFAEKARAEAEKARAEAEKARAEADKSRIATDTQRQRAEAGEWLARQRAYAADMQLVQQSLSADNLVRALELLNRHKPLAGQEDLRGWEWRYLWQFCRTDAISELCQRQGSIYGLSLSGDGQWLAIGDVRSGLSVLNMTTRQEITVPDVRGRIRAAFAPQGPLLAASTNKTPYRIVIWNIDSRRTVRELPLSGECIGLSFSADGQTLITSTEEAASALTLWRIEDGSAIRRVAAPEIRGVMEGTPFAATADLKSCAHGTQSQELRVVDLSSGRKLWHNEGAARGNTVGSLAFSRDGRLLASGAAYEDPVIRLWDVASGKLIRVLEGHRGWVAALLFWPDGKKLASASTDRTIRIWDVASGRVLNTLRGHGLEVWRLALLPDESTLVSSGKGAGPVLLWNALTPHTEFARNQLPLPVLGWRFAEDSKSLMTVDMNGQVARWHGRGFREMRTELELGHLTAPGSPTPQRAEFSPDLRYIALKRSGAAREVEVWDVPSANLRYRLPAGAETFPVAAFRDRHTLLVFDEHNAGAIQCREWDLRSGRETHSWPVSLRGTGRVGIVLSPDGQRCVLNPGSGVAVVYDFRTRSHTPAGSVDPPRLPQFSPDGKLLAVSLMGSHLVKLRETSTYRDIATLSSMVKVPHSVAFSPDGARLAVGGGGAEAIVLWTTQSHEPVLSLDGVGSIFLATAFSPDGNCLGSRSTFTSNNYGILHVWRAPSLAEIEATEKLDAGRR
jgi:WD40 repeat protein/tRNA A-37 threonylcarbamoyl transferase component Bud32